MNQVFRSTVDKILFIILLLLFAVLPFTRAGMNIFVGLAIIIFVFKIIVVKDMRRIKLADSLPALALLVSAILSTIGSANFNSSLRELISPWLKYIVVYFAVIDVVSTPKRQRLFVGVFLLGGLISSCYAIYQYFGLSIPRVSSFMNNPNPAGTYLAMYTLLSLALFLITKNIYLRVLLMTSTFLGVMGVLFTMSRGALLGLAVAFILFTFLLGKLWGIRKTLLLFVLIGIFITAIMPERIVDRFQDVTNMQDNSNRQRIYLLVTGWEMFCESMLIGKGLGSFKILYPSYKIEGAIDFDHIHNLYVHIMAEMGLVGITAFLWFFFSIIKRSLSNVLTNKKDVNWGINMAAFLSGVVLAIHSLVDVTFVYSQVGLPLVGLAALTMYPDPDIQDNL